MKKQFWERGQRAKLCKITGLSPQYLSDVLHRRKTISLSMAKFLNHRFKRVLKIDIPIKTWVFNKTTKHKAFFKKPHKK